MKTTSLTTYNYIIAANSSVKINRQFRHIRGLSGTEPYKVRFPDGSPAQFQTGLAYNSPVTLEEVELINDSAAAISIGIALADGPIDDNRLVGNVDISGGIRTAGNRTANYGAVSVGTGGAIIRAANMNRGKLFVQNNGAADMFVGTDASVTTSTGVRVAANGTAEFTMQTALYGITASGTADIRFIDEEL